MADTQHNELDARHKVWDLIKEVRVATLVTQSTETASEFGSSGNMLRARPMVAIERAEGANELWFYSPAASGKMQEIENCNQVCLSYSEPSDQTYVSISGTATISHDRTLIKQFWSEPMRTWFPEGADDPNLALIRVVPEAAEYWDAPSSTLVYAYGYLKARLTGKSPNPGDHAHVSM